MAEAAAADFVEKSAEELAKLTKAERTAYYQARQAALKEQQAPKKQLTKAERRQLQEAQRKAKADKQDEADSSLEVLEELKLQGLSEEQAKEMLQHLATAVEVEEDEEDMEDLEASVRRWMSEQPDTIGDQDAKDTLQDFNMSVRFQGHVDSTPPDHVGSILKVISEECCKIVTVGEKLQPTTVSKQVEPLMSKWGGVLEQLVGRIDDALVVADVVVGTVHETVRLNCSMPDCLQVGILMALREHTEVISDDDMLTGCRRLQERSRVMEKFIDFLEEAVEDEDEEGDSDA
mmetsp:Transcript_13405/g.24669  ORF Transcript_13405/g.24669 Transcript_13405/m.24669 type:complete len:290 (+) Transcript_13405:47-916(+)